jgi:glutaredoxin
VPRTINLTLLTKPGCHLCDDAATVVAGVIKANPELPLVIEGKNIEDDVDLFGTYWDQIPVLLINGKVHNYWRIDPERLTQALKELS